MNKQLIDTYKHQGLRRKLVEKLRKKPFAHKAVVDVIATIPRHLFADDALAEHIYEDKAFPIQSGQTISQPSTVAYQTSLLQLTKNDVVLEIGTGSGYQTLILAKLSKYVLSVERQKQLYKHTKAFLPQFGLRNIELFYGDGYRGLPNYAPFDKILVTAAAPHLPQALIDQLKPKGRMVIPVNNSEGSQTMYILDKDEQGVIHQEKGEQFRFVPLLRGKNR